MKYKILKRTRTTIDVCCHLSEYVEVGKSIMRRKRKMNETSQAIIEIKREVKLSEWQRQIQARQEQGISVDEWCMRMGISKGAYYHRLRKVREYMCQKTGVTDDWACQEFCVNDFSTFFHEKLYVYGTQSKG